jgi:hypothetical protein
MTEFGKKIGFAVVGGIILIGIAVFAFSRMPDQATQPTVDQTEKEIASLRSFVTAANEASGIQSGAIFDYSLVTYGNPSNFSIQQCRDEVRCDVINPISVAKFQQPNHPSPDYAEVETKTNTVISLHRAVPEFVGGEYPADKVEQIAIVFLNQVYPDFKTLEPTLTPGQNMKGSRLNNGNYFFRWDDVAYKDTLPEGVQVEVDPFIQIGITASGFIFSYDNTVALSRLQNL